jgi:hypothetical protein
MLVNRLRDDRGGIIALTAFLVPVFLIIAALVIDVGTWYTHKRQLQTRADAGALAAGYEYGQQILRCLSTDPTAVAAAETELSKAARAFAGDPTYTPDATGGPDGLPDPVRSNTEVTEQGRLSVYINSADTGPGNGYDGPSNSDGGGPCFRHSADNISPAGQWVDVKVKYENTNSLFGMFGVDLIRNIARARVEIRPAESLSGFVPLGVPDNRIAKAVAVVRNGCTGAQLGATITLKPLASAHQSIPNLTVWGPDDGLSQPTTTPVPFTILMPAGLTGCPGSQDYVPLSVEVRAAGRPDIDINPPVSCSSVAARPQADCWTDATVVRAWATEGDPGGPLSGDTVLVEDVILTGSGGPNGCSQDPHYARSAEGATSCTFDASVTLDFDRRTLSPGRRAVATLVVDGDDYPLSGGTVPYGTWSGVGITAPLDRSNVQLEWGWNCNASGRSCSEDGTVTIHRVHVTPPVGPFEALTAVRLTSGPTSGGLNSVKLTSPSGGQQNYTAHLRVGLKSSFQFGDFAVLRLRSGGRNYSLVCDPRFSQPSTTDMEAAFYFGCQPPYARNPLTNGYWWDTSQEAADPGRGGCPDWGDWFHGTGTPPGPPYTNAPWMCVHADTGGNGFGLTDGIALATGNCQAPAIDESRLTASCHGHRYSCNNPINVPQPGDIVDLDDPRIIKIYILPFNAFNNVPTGNNTDLPVIDFAAFYVTAWKYNTRQDPCPGNDNARLPNLGEGEVGGYFVQWVEPGGGAVDPDATCSLSGVTPCRAVLVR